MVIKPSWEDFYQVIKFASESLMICSPFYTGDALGLLFDRLDNNPSIEIITRLSPSDWKIGISDPENILSLMEIYNVQEKKISLYIHQRLHAKAYIANETFGIIGSSNLTGGGFQHNFELMVKVSENDAKSAYQIIQHEKQINARKLEMDNLKLWINQSKDIIEKARVTENDYNAELSEVQKSLDSFLNYGGKHRTNGKMDDADLLQFVEWLNDNNDLFGSQVLLEHYRNTQGANRTGHFKQCFFIVAFFYEDYPELKEKSSRNFKHINTNNWMHFTDDFILKWVNHLGDHATDIGENYNYPTMRSILSTNLGGTLSNGGGASGTLKRMFHLLAIFLEKGFKYE